jgi:hypothetical protein
MAFLEQSTVIHQLFPEDSVSLPQKTDIILSHKPL